MPRPKVKTQWAPRVLARALQPVQRLQQWPSALVAGGAILGHADPPGVGFGQPDLEMRFQRLDRLAERGCRHLQRLGRAHDVATLHDTRQGAHGLQVIHGVGSA